MDWLISDLGGYRNFHGGCGARLTHFTPVEAHGGRDGMIPIVQISQSSEGSDDREKNYLLLSPEDTEDSAASARDKS